MLTRSRQKRGTGGFTLLELMVVIVILGILATYVGAKIITKTDEAKQQTARVQIESLSSALKYYRLHNGHYPSTEQGLQALVEPPSTGRQPKKWQEGGYLEKNHVPKDPWGNDYVYISPGVHEDFDISSYGADNQPGGEGFDADINSWETDQG
ncbi:MAG: type II secretion system major pseudopilin GspG [Desulfatibacillaceae bacterium]